MNTNEKSDQQKLWELCQKFIIENNVYNREIVFISKRLPDKYYGLVGDICDIIGYQPLAPEDDE